MMSLLIRSTCRKLRQTTSDLGQLFHGVLLNYYSLNRDDVLKLREREVELDRC